MVFSESLVLASLTFVFKTGAEVIIGFSLSLDHVLLISKVGCIIKIGLGSWLI